METIREAAPQVAQLCEQKKCFRILNDMRAAKIEISMVEAFQSPAIMDKSGSTRTMRRALVVASDFNKAEFIETVTRNRGHDLMVFNDIEKARQWWLSKA
jgi:hypothetical protein